MIRTCLALIILAMVGTLRLLGRGFWCKCGSAKPWISQPNGQCTSQHAADPYSFTHVIHGLGLYMLVWLVEHAVVWVLVWLFLLGLPSGSFSGFTVAERIAVVVLLEALWEILENTPWAIERYRKVTISRGYYGDSIGNSVGDALCCLAGAWFASVTTVSWSVALAVAIELSLLLAIRDCLTLNIVMLMHPIEKVRKWQEGDRDD